MPNVKVEAWRRIRAKLEFELNALVYKKQRNKYQINCLAKEQAIIKKQICSLQQLLKELPT